MWRMWTALLHFVVQLSILLCTPAGFPLKVFFAFSVSTGDGGLFELHQKAPKSKVINMMRCNRDQPASSKYFAQICAPFGVFLPVGRRSCAANVFVKWPEKSQSTCLVPPDHILAIKQKQIATKFLQTLNNQWPRKVQFTSCVKQLHKQAAKSSMFSRTIRFMWFHFISPLTLLRLHPLYLGFLNIVT